MNKLSEGRTYIEHQLRAFHAKLGTGEVELTQYIAFVELCTKALKVLEALEKQLEEN